jgi:hypothetical protein
VSSDAVEQFRLPWPTVTPANHTRAIISALKPAVILLAHFALLVSLVLCAAHDFVSVILPRRG